MRVVGWRDVSTTGNTCSSQEGKKSLSRAEKRPSAPLAKGRKKIDTQTPPPTSEVRCGPATELQPRLPHGLHCLLRGGGGGGGGRSESHVHEANGKSSGVVRAVLLIIWGRIGWAKSQHCGWGWQQHRGPEAAAGTPGPQSAWARAKGRGQRARAALSGECPWTARMRPGAGAVGRTPAHGICFGSLVFHIRRCSPAHSPEGRATLSVAIHRNAPCTMTAKARRIPRGSLFCAPNPFFFWCGQGSK